MYNPLQFHAPVNARFDQAGQMATQIAEQDRVRNERANALQGFQGLQMGKPQVEQDLATNQMQALGSPSAYMDYQLQKQRAEKVGRRGITGNAQSIQTAIKAQAPFESQLNIMENELNSMKPTDEGYQEKFATYQNTVGQHDQLAFNEGQKWAKKGNTRQLAEELQEDKRKQTEHALKIKSYENTEFKDFRKNWQTNNNKLVDSSKLTETMGSNIPSASRGNTQSVATLVKKMARLASNEAITMPELELGFNGTAEQQASAWVDKWAGSGNRIPEAELRSIKETYNEQAEYYNDKLDEVLTDAVRDWQKANPRAKKSTRNALVRQLMGTTFKPVPLWKDDIKYKVKDGAPTPTPNPTGQSDRGKGTLPPPNDNSGQKKWDETNKDQKKIKPKSS